MPKFLTEQRRSLITLAIALLWIALFSIWKNFVTANPVDMTIALATVGETKQSVLIFSPEAYAVNLVVERGNMTTEKLERLIGSMRPIRVGESTPQQGISVPIEWTLSNAASGRLAASGRTESTTSNAWSATHVFRTLGHFTVPVGRYVFAVKTPREIPEFSNIATRIVAQTRASTSTTWQMSFVWLGNIATIIVAWPAAAISLVFLLYRFFRRLTVDALETK